MSASSEIETVESFLSSRCLTLATSINRHSATLITQLQSEMDSARAGLIGLHHQLVGGRGGDDHVDGEDYSGESKGEKENDNTSSTSSSSTSTSTTTNPSKKRKSSTPTSPVAPPQKKQSTASTKPPIPLLQITITTGPHMNTTLSIPLIFKTPALIGRSTGKKFKDKGVSLCKDLEVSTTHGKFMLVKKSSDYVVEFVDTGSTNGSFLIDSEANETRIEEGEGVEVDESVQIRVGVSIMTFGVGMFE